MHIDKGNKCILSEASICIVTKAVICILTKANKCILTKASICILTKESICILTKTNGRYASTVLVYFCTKNLVHVWHHGVSDECNIALFVCLFYSTWRHSERLTVNNNFYTSNDAPSAYKLLVPKVGQHLPYFWYLHHPVCLYRKGLGTCDPLLCMFHTLQSALESGQEARIVQIGLSAVFDRVNHQGILYISSSLWVLEILCCPYWHNFYQTDHSTLWWMVLGVNWLTLYLECSRAVCSVHYCSSCTHRSFFNSGKSLIGYADDSTLMAVVPSQVLELQ